MMAAIQFAAEPDIVVQGNTGADRAEFVLAEEVINLDGATPTAESGLGHTWSESVSSGSTNRWRAYIDEPGEDFTVALESLTPSRAVMDATGGAAWVSDGEALLRVRYPGREARLYRREMRQVGVASAVEMTGHQAGSLAGHCHAALFALLDGKASGAATQRYLDTNNLDPDSPAVTLNGAHFMDGGGYDFSGVSIMSERSTGVSENRHVALISDTHASVATHFSPGVGYRVVFRRTNGTYQVATVDSKTDIGNDISILTFTAPVTGLPTYKVITQAQLAEYAPLVEALGSRHALLGVRRSRHFADTTVGSALLPQLFRVSGALCYYTYSEASESRMYGWLSPRYGAPRAWVSDRAYGGDSSGPSFLLIDGAPVLLGHAYLPSYCYLLAGTSWTGAVNTAMGAESLQHPDLSGFTSFA